MLPYPRRSFLGVSAAAGVLHVPREVSLLRSRRVRCSARGGVRREGRDHLPDPAVRARRAPRRARDRAVAAHAARRLHAGRESVSAGVGADSAHAAEDRVRGRADARRRRTTEIFSVDEVVGITPGAVGAAAHRAAVLVPPRARRGSVPELFWTRAAASDRVATRQRHRRAICRSSICRPARCTRTATRSRRASRASTATCRAGCRSAMRRATSSSRTAGRSAGSWRSASPRDVVQPPLGQAQLWRLISQLSLNYLSLVDGGADALREMLRLYNFSDTAAGERRSTASSRLPASRRSRAS